MVALFNTFYQGGLHMACDSLMVDMENPDAVFCSMDSFGVVVVYLN